MNSFWNTPKFGRALNFNKQNKLINSASSNLIPAATQVPYDGVPKDNLPDSGWISTARFLCTTRYNNCKCFIHLLHYCILTALFPIVLMLEIYIYCDNILGVSIKCWECRSDSDPKCSDPFDNSTLSITDCKQEAELGHLPGVRPTMCRKIRQKGKY